MYNTVCSGPDSVSFDAELCGLEEVALRRTHTARTSIEVGDLRHKPRDRPPALNEPSESKEEMSSCTVQAAGHSDEEVEQDKTVVKTERHGKE
ncbi:hypothetical protein BDV98DRAFT_564861 [Pterulicium gracile]|uniref:Uncharacterized protein n=1 Tax=Pterulicium gracile TaxID=1884261 RepID=A0A5C3QWR9_9AGAR|nr:hypothetical protein BDV98DRAFT_564861 [Pterula gracilis]